MITSSDIIKGNFLAEFSAISVGEMLIALVLSFFLSLFVVYIYRITYAGVSFSRSFAGCLIMISMVTAMIILVITSNVVLSLGMVGALSIVRFRTAVKEPSDTAFLFWAIATGIICGAGYITIAILATAILGLLFVAVYTLGKKYHSDTHMIVVRCSADCQAEAELMKLPGYKLKNKTMSATATELAVEIRLDSAATEKLSELRALPGVTEITVMRSTAGSVL